MLKRIIVSYFNKVNLVKFSSKKLTALLLLEAFCILLFRYYQPQCEPCLPGSDCPPCLSTIQIVIAAIGGVGLILLIVLVALKDRQ